jgi:hypothetical protein
VVIKQGTGARKPGGLRRPELRLLQAFERDLLTVKDVTIYTFLYPILGPDSNAKSRDIWCSKDAAKAWRAWMLDGTRAAQGDGQCDTAALDRNVEFGRKHRMQGTPALFFEDGTRKPGALSAAEVEKLLAARQEEAERGPRRPRRQSAHGDRTPRFCRPPALPRPAAAGAAPGLRRADPLRAGRAAGLAGARRGAPLRHAGPVGLCGGDRLSFLGGIHWGLAMREASPRRRRPVHLGRGAVAAGLGWR